MRQLQTSKRFVDFPKIYLDLNVMPTGCLSIVCPDSEERLTSSLLIAVAYRGSRV